MSNGKFPLSLNLVSLTEEEKIWMDILYPGMERTIPAFLFQKH